MKGKILTAKVIVFILLFMLIGISLLKFVDYLNKPASRFYDVLESVNTDVNDVMNMISQTDIYSLFNSEAYTINADTKVSTTGMTNTEYEKYNDLLNNSSFISKIDVDKSKNYIGSSLEITSGTNKYEINYYENRTNKYLGSMEEYTQLSSSSNFKLFNTSNITSLISNLIDFSKNEINAENISSDETAIGVNGKTYDVVFSSYEISGDEFNTLVKNGIVNLTKNNTIQNYLVEILGISKSELSKVLYEKYENLGILSNKNYLINAYVDSKSNDTLKLEILENNSEKRVIISYSMVDNFHEFYMNMNDNIKLLRFIGDVNNYQIDVQNEKNIISFTNKLEGDNYVGNVSILDSISNQEKEKLEYSYTKTTNETDVSLSLRIKLYPILVSSNIEIEINSSILINKNTSISRVGISNYVEENKSDVTIKNYIDEYLEKVYNSFNGINIQPNVNITNNP